MNSKKHHQYGEEYFKNNNYSDYLERGERYYKSVRELTQFLIQMKILDEYTRNENILDVGCSVGFVVNAFHSLGWPFTFGFDTSEWAIKFGTEKLGIKNLFTDELIFACGYRVVTVFDVFEHLTIEEIETIFNNLQYGRYLIVRIPVCLPNEKEYYLKASRMDPTHQPAKTKAEWNDIFENYGYSMVCRINLNTIFDSDGVFCAIYKRGKVYENI